MSSHVARLADRAEEACLRIAWRQWNVLVASSDDPAASDLVDPEALIFASLVGLRRERRLEDRLRWWAAVGVGLTGAQRLRTICSSASEAARREAARFAATAAAADRGWRRLAGEALPYAAPPRRGVKGPPRLALVGPAALMLRIRAAFGVSAKSDLLAYLIGVCDGPRFARGAAAEPAARALRYSTPSIRRALQEMALSGVVTTSPGRPARYAVVASDWMRAFRIRSGASGRETPRWRDWPTIIGFLDAIVALGADGRLLTSASIVQSSRLRDVHDRFAEDLDAAGLPTLDPSRTPGDAFAPAFEGGLDAILDEVGVGRGGAKPGPPRSPSVR